MPEVVIIGGGVIGLSTAYELAGQGCAVRVVDQGPLGQEASWAGAGMLPPGGLDGPVTLESQLRAHSFRLWSQWAAAVTEASGIDTGYRRCGCFEFRSTDAAATLSAEIETWRREGVPVEPLSAADMRARFPAVHAGNLVAYWLADAAQVRNPRLLKALMAACLVRGVQLSPGRPVQELRIDNGRVSTIETPTESIAADEFVLAAGAWSQGLLNRIGLDLRAEPVKGQMVLLEQQPSLVTCIVQSGLRYIVPRADGRILIGATEERVGFDKSNTAEGVSGLLTFAQQVIPGLRGARFERSWAGLRPWRPGGLPVIGRAPGVDNLIVASGHFRSGLQLSPITAQLIRQLICRQPLSIPPALLETALQSSAIPESPRPA